MESQQNTTPTVDALLASNSAGMAALVLGAGGGIPVICPALQGLGFGIALNFRLPAAGAATMVAILNDQPNNATIGGVTFNREALAIVGGTVQVLAMGITICGTPLGWPGLADVALTAGTDVVANPQVQALLRKYTSADLTDSELKGLG